MQNLTNFNTGYVFDHSSQTSYHPFAHMLTLNHHDDSNTVKRYLQ